MRACWRSIWAGTFPAIPTVIPQNMPGAGSIKAANYVYSVAPKDGTVIGTFARGMAGAALIGQANFDARKFTWLGSMTKDVTLCISWNTSPIKTWNDAMTKQFTAGGEGAAGDPDIFAKLYKNVFGAKIRLATGFPGTTDITLAMQRHEVDGLCGISWSTVKARYGNWVKEKKINILIQAAPAKAAGPAQCAARQRVRQNDGAAPDPRFRGGERSSGAPLRGAAGHSGRAQGGAARRLRCHTEGPRLPRRREEDDDRHRSGERAGGRCGGRFALRASKGRGREGRARDLLSMETTDSARDGRIGSRFRRLEDAPLLTGQGRFVDDIRIPGLLHVAFVRSPHAHAAIRTIDGRAARALPGVYAVLTLDDLMPVLAKRRMVREPGQGGKPRENLWPYPLSCGEVAFVGEPVALVAAANRYVAEDAAALVEVDYDLLTPVTDAREAALPGAHPVRRELSSNVVSTYRVAYGDTDAAFRNAAHVFREDYFQHRGGAHSLEGRGCVAEYQPGMDGITLWASTQKAHDLHQNLAAFVRIDENHLRVVAPDIGGGFGPKLCVYPEDVAIVAAAKLLKRSLKWAEDRREHFIAAVQERDQYWTLELAMDAEARAFSAFAASSSTIRAPMRSRT